jgi:uncharacterized oligopeptide transporter (OPT) family protein
LCLTSRSPRVVYSRTAMSLFQKPPETAEELKQNRPLAIPPEQVQEFSEAEWYEKAYRGESTQLTARALLMGSILGFFLSFTNIYIGLKTGWFLGVAITACIVSFAVWSMLLKAGIAKTPMTILENTCMASTASSAGYATGNMLVTAIPAMLLLSATEANPLGTQLPWWMLGMWVFFIAALGVVMAIPMKRNMINQERLKFPSGTAAAVTLQSLYSEGAEALVKARALLWSGLVGVTVPLLKDLEFRKVLGPDGKVTGHQTLLPGQSNLFDWGFTMAARQYDQKLQAFVDKGFKPSDWLFRLDHSLVLLAAGAIVGLRTTISMVAGALALGLWIGPWGMSWLWESPSGKMLTAATKPGTAWKEIGIWCGAPLMDEPMNKAVGFGGKRADSPKEGEADPTAGVEVPGSWFATGMLAAGLVIVALAWAFFSIPPYLGVLAVLMTFFLALVAARATGETDITPGGPLGKIVQLTYGVLMPQSTTANLMTASITSGSSLASADLLNDLKSGYLLGANPRRQFVAQFAGIFTGTVASVLGYFLMIPDATKLSGVGDHAPAFPAPGAQQWKAVAELFKVGIDNLHPMNRGAIEVAIVVGITLALLERFLPKHKHLIPSATGLGLGVLLPFFSSFSMFLGAVVAWGFARLSPKQAERFVVPISSGLIAGESIIGVIVAGLNNFVFT